MSDEKIKQILASLSAGIENVSFLHDAYLQLMAYGNSGPLSAEVAQAIKRIRIYSARQVEIHRYVVLTPDNAVDFDVYLNILEKSPHQSPEKLSEIRGMRTSLAPYLKKFDEENDISSVNEKTNVNANADLWSKATSLISPVRLHPSSEGPEQYSITKGFDEFVPFFSSIDKKSYSEIVELARLETIQSLSKNPPSADRKANREIYIAKMREVLGQISVELLHEYKHREFQVFSSTDKSFYAQDAYLDNSLKNKFDTNTFADKKHLKAALSAVTCTRSAHMARVATRLQIKSRAKDIWQKVYEWDDKMAKRHSFLYPAAKSVTISLTTGMVGSIAYSGYKLEKSIRQSVENYQQNANKQRYKDYFSYITAKENFNELVDLGKSTALIAVSGIFAGSVIAEHGISAASGMLGQISEHGVGSLISGSNASQGFIDKIKHMDFSSFVKSLASNTKIWASSAVSISAGVATGVSTSLQQRQAEIELDELLKLRGATKFPHDSKTLKLRSSDPETYYALVIKNNEITVSEKDQKLFDEKILLINRKRQEKKRRGWGSGIGTVLGLAGAGIFGSGSGKVELHDNINTDTDFVSETDISEHIRTIQPETPEFENAHIRASANNLATFASPKSGSLADNDEITVGEKLRIIKGEHPNVVLSERSEASVPERSVSTSAQSTPKTSQPLVASNNYGTDTDENRLVSEKIKEHTALSSAKNRASSEASNVETITDSSSEVITAVANLDGFTPSQTGLSYKIDDDGSIIFKGGIPDDQTAAQIEAEAYANLKNAEADDEEISIGERAFMNEYAYNNDINVAPLSTEAPVSDYAEVADDSPVVIDETADYVPTPAEVDKISEPDTYVAENTQTEQTHLIRVTPRHNRTHTVVEDDVYYRPSKRADISRANTSTQNQTSDCKYFYSVSKGFFSFRG